MRAVPGLGGRSGISTFWRVVAGVLVVGLVAQVVGVPTAAAEQRQQPTRSTAAPVAERPDRPSALLTARVQGSRVEIMSERTETSSTYANPDGTLTTDLYTGPIRFRDRAGNWRDIDVTLEQAADGSVRARGHPLGLALAGPGGTPGKARDLVRLSTGGRQVALGWRGRLPRPVVEGTRATYPEVLPDVDLVVEATRTGFEQFLVVKARPADPAALAVTLPVAVRGLTARSRAGKGVEFVDARGRVAGLLGEPVMWDARVDTRSGEHPRRAPVAMRVTGAGAAVAVRLVPDKGFLADPATVYPVTIDPSYTNRLYSTFDTFVETDYSSDQSGATELRLGTYDGANKARSFLNLDMSPWAGRDIISADLSLWEFHSSSCQAREWRVHRTDRASTATRWTSQPAWYAIWGSSTQTRGYNATCDDGWVSTDLTDLIQAWADQSAGAVAIGLRAASETDVYGWKKFNSGDAASNIPRMNITYDSYPYTPTNRSTVPATTCVTGAGRPWINTATPTLRAAVSDPDGGSVSGNFEVWPTGGSGSVWSGTSAGVTSGGVAAKQVAPGVLVNGGTYSWRVRGWDGSLSSRSPTSWCEFSVDTTKPVAPGVSSTAYPQGQWNLTGGAGTFTFTSSDSGSGLASWRYWLDSATPTTVSGGSPTSVSITPPNGWHALHVQAVDNAGNLSDETTWSFGAVAGVTSPSGGQRTQRFVTLGAVGPPTATGVRFQYQLPGTATWADIPTGQVTLAGMAVGSWPVATVADASAARAPANLVWDVRATMSNVDGPITVQAVLTSAGSSWTTDAITTTLDQKAFGDSYATQGIGPGSVSLLTGNYSVSATDASIAAWGGGATITRTFNSLSATASGVFGPGWQSSLAVEGAEWTGLTDTGSGVVLSDVDGGLTVFAKSGSGYLPLGDAAAAGLALAKTASPDEFTLTDLDGRSTTFGFLSGPATPTLTNPRLYRLSRVTHPGSNQVASYTYNPDGTPAQILLPKPTTATVCDQTTWSPGCRALQLSYAGGKLTKVTIKATDGAGAVKVIDTGCYTYDAAGRLSQAWDPSITGTTCGSPVLATTYTYDTAGRIATVTPPGLAAWTIGYDPQGRLDTVSRTHDAANGGGTETTTLRYNVPFGATASSDEAHPDLSAARAAAWAQTDLPVTATVAFDPGDAVSSTDLRDGQVHALDVNGREVNTAGFSGTGQAGWKVSTSEYDQYGNTVRTLSAANREVALTGDPTRLGLPADTSTSTLAEALNERSFYTPGGTDLLDTYGPLHAISIDGAWVNARQHIHLSYGTLDTPGTDPTVNGPKHLEIQRTIAASQSAATTPTNQTDLRTTRSSYALSASDATGWTFRAPMAVTTVMGDGTPDIVRQIRYDATTGQVIETRQPAAAGTSTSPATTKTTYYTAGAHNPATCVSSAWYGLACKVEPGAQPAVAGLPQLPVKTFTYDVFLRPTVVTETVVDAAGTTRTRATTTTYENAGNGPRQVSSQVTGGLGTAVPATTTGYDAATGLSVTTATATTPAVTITMTYDDFGRPHSVTDADNATTEATYSPTSGRPQTMTWKDPAGAVLGTQTLGYDGHGEHRGLPTSITDPALSGAITGTYDADGALVSQAFPSGMTQTTTRDPSGNQTGIVYAKGGVEWVNDSQSSNIHGQWRWHSGPAGWEAYGYDPAGRLQAVWDGRLGQQCVQRAYTYDVDSNRITSSAWPADPTGACPPGTTGTDTTHAYDAADRLLPQGVDAGLAYDAFGRITTLPGSAAGGTAASIAYYVTDMVASQAQGSATRSWTLDPARRLRAAETTGQSTKINHYSDSGDSPAWTDEGDGTRTRYVTGLDGNLAAAVTSTVTTVTDVRYQLVGLHGDVITTTSPEAATPDGAFLDYDEYGSPRGTTPTSRYGWLGGKQRSSDSLAGLTLMGVRLYNPRAGRFLQVDPVECGSASRYDYARQDPLNTFDLDGRQCTSPLGSYWPGIFDFRAACAWHDWCYHYAPYGRTYWGRYLCDLGFLFRMIDSCRRMHSWWDPRRGWCINIAYLYYAAVRKFGWIFFYSSSWRA